MWTNPKYQAESPPLTPAETGKRLATFPRAQGAEELRIDLSEFNGHPFVSMRIWALSQATGKWWPTKKGVSVRLHEIPDIIAVLSEVLGSESEGEARPARQAPPKARSSATPRTVPAPRALAPGRG